MFYAGPEEETPAAEPETDVVPEEAEEETTDAEPEEALSPEDAEEEVSPEEPEEALSQEEGEEDVSPDEGMSAPPDTRSVEERTGAIYYAPAMDASPDGDAAAGDGRAFRFELGVRCLGVWLTEDRKGEPFHGSYIGSIYKLKAKQNWAPIHPYVQAKFATAGGVWLGIGAAYSHLEVQTLDNGGGDGDIVTDAALAYLLLERPIGSWFRPYAEIGGGIAFNSFDATDDWGSGHLREFDLDNSGVFLAAAGCAFDLTSHISLDAHVRYLYGEVDGKYIYRGDSRPDTDFTFPISHVAAGIGASYVF